MILLSQRCEKLSKWPIPDAGRGELCRAGEDHAGLQDEGDVQTEHGGTGAVYVPAGHAHPGAHPRPLCSLPVPGYPHQPVRQQLVPHSVCHQPTTSYHLQVRQSFN